MGIIKRIALFIPTHNAGDEFGEILDKVNEQDENIDYKFIIDSSSTDMTVDIAFDKGFNVIKIPKSEFGHGKTRTAAVKHLEKDNFDYVIFMTQDVFLQKNALDQLISFIKTDDKLALVYGKQEVDLNKSNIFEKRARSFNYPDRSIIKSKKDINKLGIKTAFTSDAFCIYDINKIHSVNYFPSHIEYSEDMYIATQFIKANLKIGYCAEAKVFHSHNFSLKDEFQRYNSIGKFHKENPEIQNYFGKNTSEGKKLVLSDIAFLFKEKKWYLLPEYFVRTLVKYIGYITA